LIIKSSNHLLDLIPLSESRIKLSVSFLNNKDFLINSLPERPDPLIELSLLSVEDLHSKLLIFNLLLSGSQVALKLKDPIILLVFDIVIVCDLSLETLDVSPEDLIVEADLLEFIRCTSDLDVLVINSSLYMGGLLMDADALVLTVFDLLLDVVEVSLEKGDGLLLVSNAFFMVALLLRDFTF